MFFKELSRLAERIRSWRGLGLARCQHCGRVRLSARADIFRSFPSTRECEDGQLPRQILSGTVFPPALGSILQFRSTVLLAVPWQQSAFIAKSLTLLLRRRISSLQAAVFWLKIPPLQPSLETLYICHLRRRCRTQVVHSLVVPGHQRTMGSKPPAMTSPTTTPLTRACLATNSNLRVWPGQVRS